MDVPIRLSDYKHDVYSQHGEDGVLAKVFELTGPEAGYFVEFGAWDGRHLSNTFALTRKGWSGCLIEGNPDRYDDLIRGVSDTRIATVCRYVAPHGPDSLDSILDDVGSPATIDLLSIDIDSDDLAIWRSVERHRARCVVIEYNPTIPFDSYFENPQGKQWGNSALSIVTFATPAHYALVCVTGTNLIFYDRGAPGSSLLQEVSLSEAARGARYFWGYDGTFLRLAGNERYPEDHAPEVYGIPWTNFVTVQAIPKPLRGYLDGGSAIGMLRHAFGLVQAVCLRPVSSVRAALRRFKGQV